LLLLATSAAFADAPPDYRITSPYAGVNWETDGVFKANLHAHTTFSDGNHSMAEVVEEYYRQGYDILATSDHGIVSVPWDQSPRTVFPLDIQNWGKERPVLSSERLAEITAGVNRGGRGMLRVPQSIEMNAAVVNKSHVNGFFGGWGQGWWGLENDYRSAIDQTERSGGISHLNHPGDWIQSSDDAAIARDPKNVNFFAALFRDYPSLVGMEIYNRVDTVTRHDRILWDELLRRLVPEGRLLWGFANDDSHVMSDIGGTAEFFLMPSNTAQNLRKAMESGAFFASSRRDRVVLGDAFVGDAQAAFPMVSKITVDEAADVITLTVTDTEKVEWIADGKVIATGAVLSLREHAEEITCYVRAQLIGPGGITATQPFALEDGSGYVFPDDSLQGWEKFKFDLLLFLRSNMLVALIELLIDQIG
jgi:hypothetical protein